MLQEFTCLVDLHIDIVLSGLGSNTNFLEFLLVRLVLGDFDLLYVAELAVVHDLADRRPFGGGHLDEIELGLAGHFQRLRRRHYTQLLAVDADEPNWGDADLIVDPLAGSVELRMTVWGNTLFSFSIYGVR